MTWRELQSVLEGSTGEYRVEIGYYSEARLRKKGSDGAKCPYTGVMKMAVYSGIIGKRHQDAEKEAVERRGTGHELPVVQARKWGHRVGDSCIIKHGDRVYLEMTEVNELWVVYSVDGVPLLESQVADWLPFKEEIVSLRDFDLSKIRSIQFPGQTPVEVT